MTTVPSRPTLNDAERRATIRVPVPEPRRLVDRLLARYSRRTYGDVADNGLVLMHHRRALWATLLHEWRVSRFDVLDPGLRTLAVMGAAATIGCSWCLDFGYYEAHGRGMDLAKLREVPRWRDSEAFTETERRVLAFAEAATVTPPEVTDAMVEELVADLGTPAVVELTTMVALENHRSRFNSALGLTSQGFSDRCEIPPERRG